MNYPSVLVEDSRNQIGKHKNIKDFCDANGIRIIRSKLICGDYSLPTDQSICVDTKQGMNEIYSNMVQEHDRFRRECDLAHELGIRLVILVEEDGISCLQDVSNWKNPRYERYMAILIGHKHGRYMGTKLPPRKPIDSPRLQQMMKTFAEHHHCEWRFCRKEDTGKILMEILTGGI